MSIAKHLKIPDEYIELADEYKIMPMDNYIPIDLGGRIMLRQVVFEQMTIDNIVATSGLTRGNQDTDAKTVCIIIVSYSHAQVVEMIENAKRLIGKLIDDGGSLDGKN